MWIGAAIRADAFGYVCAGDPVGAYLGIDGIPAHWYDRFNDTIMTYITDHGRFSIEDAVDRFTALNG